MVALALATVLAAAPVPKSDAAPASPNKLVFSRSGDLVRIDPDGRNEEKLTTPDPLVPLINNARLSPDGKRLALLTGKSKNRLAVAECPRASGAEPVPVDLGVECRVFAWSADGTEIVCSDLTERRDGATNESHAIVNVTTKKLTPLKLPKDHVVTDWSRDGKYFLTMTTSADLPVAAIHRWNRDGTGHKVLTDAKKEGAMCGQFSPDGARVLYIRFPAGAEIEPDELGLGVLDLVTGKASNIAPLPAAGEVRQACWSPDGKRIAFTWREVHLGARNAARPNNQVTNSFLVVCDPDGTNAKVVATAKGARADADTLLEVTWR